jgi:hypothetical protein
MTTMQTTAQEAAPQAPQGPDLAAEAAKAMQTARLAQEKALASAAADASSPQSVYEAARAARNELRSQLDALVSQRHGFLREIEDHEEVTGPAVSGMQQRIVALDARIAQMDTELAAADAAVARAAAVPGAVVTPLEIIRRGPPEEVFFIVPVLAIFAMMPVIIAFARRIWRRSSIPPAQLPADLTERLARLEQVGETTALEVERIGEGQRFVTKLLTERADRALAEGAAIESQR